jgi:ATPase subunit of ABC transporter with duplicated ATPase domains
MNATIEIDGLRNRFGPAQALDEVTFTVRPGQVTGFVGPNGAGKSTTMRVVGLHAPGAGTATIGDQPYRTPKNPAACPLTRCRRASISAERTLPPFGARAASRVPVHRRLPDRQNPYELEAHVERHGNYLANGATIETTRRMGTGKNARDRRVACHYAFKRSHGEPAAITAACRIRCRSSRRR